MSTRVGTFTAVNNTPSSALNITINVPVIDGDVIIIGAAESFSADFGPDVTWIPDVGSNIAAFTNGFRFLSSGTARFYTVFIDADAPSGTVNVNYPFQTLDSIVGIAVLVRDLRNVSAYTGQEFADGNDNNPFTADVSDSDLPPFYSQCIIFTGENGAGTDTTWNNGYTHGTNVGNTPTGNKLRATEGWLVTSANPTPGGNKSITASIDWAAATIVFADNEAPPPASSSSGVSETSSPASPTSSQGPASSTPASSGTPSSPSSPSSQGPVSSGSSVVCGCCQCPQGIPFQWQFALNSVSGTSGCATPCSAVNKTYIVSYGPLPMERPTLHGCTWYSDGDGTTTPLAMIYYASSGPEAYSWVTEIVYQDVKLIYACPTPCICCESSGSSFVPESSESSFIPESPFSSFLPVSSESSFAPVSPSSSNAPVSSGSSSGDTCFGPGDGFIIDDDTNTSDIVVSGQSGNACGVTIKLNGLEHTWQSDLICTITHVGAAVTVDLFRNCGDSSNFIGDYDFNDTFTNNICTAGGGGGDVPPGNYHPKTLGGANSFLADFNTVPKNGTWRLTIEDDAAGDSGALASWEICFKDCPSSASSAPSSGQGSSGQPSSGQGSSGQASSGSTAPDPCSIEELCVTVEVEGGGACGDSEFFLTADETPSGGTCSWSGTWENAFGIAAVDLVYDETTGEFTISVDCFAGDPGAGNEYTASSLNPLILDITFPGDPNFCCGFGGNDVTFHIAECDGQPTGCCPAGIPETLVASLFQHSAGVCSNISPVDDFTITWDGTKWYGEKAADAGCVWRVHLECQSSGGGFIFRSVVCLYKGAGTPTIPCQVDGCQIGGNNDYTDASYECEPFSLTDNLITPGSGADCCGCIQPPFGGGWTCVYSEPMAMGMAKQKAIAKIKASSTPFGLGDATALALETIGISKERVSGWLGKPCNCAERQAKLNKLGEWAKNVVSGKVSKAKEYLDNIIGGE